MRIIIYLIIIILGFFLGNKQVFSKKILNKLNSIQYICLLFLLFIMGINIGINKKILLSFHHLGFSALIITVFSIFFSILGLNIGTFFLKYKNGRKKS